MHSTVLKAAALSLLVAQATAKTIKINVGQSGLTYSPSTVQADKGDTLEYHFFSTHSVSMSDYKSPCTPAAKGGFFSGVQMAGGGSDMVFRVMVNSTDPIFFYCTIEGHCQGGMVGAVNPSSDETLDNYKNMAQNAEGGKAPASMFGGTLVKAGSSSGSASDSMSGAMSGSMSGTMSDATSGAMSAESTMATGSSAGTAASQTAETTGSAAASKTAAAASSSTSSAAGAVQATFGGIGAVALGFAALMV